MLKVKGFNREKRLLYAILRGFHKNRQKSIKLNFFNTI